MKSGKAVTVSERFCVLAAGAPAVLAWIVTVDVAGGVLLVVPIVSVTLTGALEVGLTEDEGRKLQLAPKGRPLQERVTIPLKAPEAVTEKAMFCDELGRFTVTALGTGVVNPKSTTCSVRAASWVMVFASEPTPCALKR